MNPDCSVSSCFRSVAAAVIALTGLALTAFAAPPDLTNGGTPGDSVTFNLGPTGARGWVYHIREDSSESRQILVTSVAAGSPADGVLAADDVILGANGTGAVPVDFTSDARKSLGLAIGDAEAQTPATLKLLRWRAGVTESVELTLQTMGAYSATAPYSCPKSALILEQGLADIMANETAGRYSFGTLSLLAANDPSDPDNAARMARAQTEALALIPDAATMTQMMSDERETAQTWQRGHTLIVLAEYYLATGDAQFLPAIEAYAVNIARNISMFGTTGHIFSEKNPDGSDNGPMGGVYGPVNSAGMPCFLGLLLARECDLSRPEFQSTTEGYVESAIERSSRFFAYYAGRGSVPYGEHEASWSGHENNGKSGLAAVCFALQDNRVEEGKFFARLAAASADKRGEGHTGAFFNYLWAPLGAATGGEELAASHFSRISWMLDLNRRWDGGFDYDCLTGEGPNSGAQYNNFRMSTAALLTYALPLRQLHLTGRGHDPVQRDLTSAEVAEAAAVDGYVASSRTTTELIADLGSWSPMVQRRAAEQLATRSIDSALLTQITNLATDPAGNSRIGACYTLGKINNSATADARAATLAGLLEDPENHVRFIAAEAMRYLPDSAKLGQLDAILTATANTATPLLPFNEEDPLHFAHGRLAMLLFYSGNAYGPRGVIYGSKINSPTPVDRALLYPAIRAVAAHPVGLPRGTLGLTYQNLTAADVDALADTLVDSIHYRAPADKMFGAPIREGGLFALERYNISEGVPLAMVFMVEDGRKSSYNNALGILEDYAGSCTTVLPDPDVIGFCEALLDGSQAAAAQAVLDAIAADTSPVTITPFKSIQSTTVDAPTLTLPVNQTQLHASASDIAQGDLVYTWRKVHGAGTVTFTPNGTAPAKDSTILFDNTPGQYLFELTVSDSRGFTEVYDTVGVTLYDTDSTLPQNDPPTADPQSVSASPATNTPITLTGSDPEGYALGFSLTSQPTHGSLTGTAPDLVYVAEADFLGTDSFTFEVMDSEGQVSGATVTITVNATGVETYVYEPFDYAPGSDIDTPLNGGTGFAGAWGRAEEGPDDSITVYDETGAWDGVVDNVPTNPEVGSRYIGGPEGDDRITAQRTLSQSAGAMAGADNVLWASVVWKMNGSNYGRHVGFALGTDGLDNRSQNVSTNGSFGSGAGDAIGVGGAISTYLVTPTIWDAGNVAVRTTVGAASVSNSMDNLLVLKFVFADGAGLDRVYAYRFTENVTFDEADFDANAIYAESAIDQDTLNILSFSQSRRDIEAIDEIRIGNSFAAVIGVEASPPDTTPPTLATTDIVDDRSGEPVTQTTPVTYTLTFSEALNDATVDASDFGNAGSSAITIDSIIQATPGVLVVEVTPTTVGTLQLQVNADALIEDLSGNPLDTLLAITDETVITVNPLLITVPDVAGLPQATAESNITSAGLAVGSVSQQFHATIPAGHIISQSPAAGTSVSSGSAVDLVVSLGPSDGRNFAIADIPVSGELAGNYADTHASDDTRQSITEIRSNGGSPQSQSLLEHKWLFEITGGDTVTFHVEAHHTANTEGDNFTFAYSTTGVDGTYQDMLTVSKTSDDDIAQTFVMPTGISGTVHVRVVDTDQTPGQSVADTLYIDQMFFESENAPPLTDMEIWVAQWPAADLTDPSADLDGDGLSNNEERVWGLDPTNAASSNPYSGTFDATTGTFSYTRRDPSLTGITYAILTSINLTGWNLDSGAVQTPGPTDPGGVQSVSVTLSSELLSATTLFVRIQATE